MKKKYDQNNKPTLSVIKKVGKFVQQCEDAEVKLEREEESEAPNVLPEPPKKKRRTKKTDITSMERIDSYMSNTYLGRMLETGQIQKAPVSKTFFEKNFTH